MKKTALALMTATLLSLPLAALADENAAISATAPISTASSTVAMPTTQTPNNKPQQIELLQVPKKTALKNDDWKSVWPRYLTIGQENEAYQRAYDETYHLDHAS